jgi:hypothetical protein
MTPPKGALTIRRPSQDPILLPEAYALKPTPGKNLPNSGSASKSFVLDTKDRRLSETSIGLDRNLLRFSTPSRFIPTSVGVPFEGLEMQEAVSGLVLKPVEGADLRALIDARFAEHAHRIDTSPSSSRTGSSSMFSTGAFRPKTSTG